MNTFFCDLLAILSRDPGGRGLMGFLPAPDLARAYEELARARRALIITGFPIRTPEGRVCCETDGPVGAADMAYALRDGGVECAVVTDAFNFGQVRAAVDCRAPGVQTHLLEKDDPGAAKRLIEEFAPTHVFPLERPGKAADGHYRNARGGVIDDIVADTDLVYALAREAGAVAIAIGDGGNELGTGAHRAAAARLVPHGETVAARLDADITLMAGVSNWWGWGVAALLSARAGRNLLPTDAEQEKLMRAVLDAGGVDGVTRLPAMTVDGLPFEANLAVLEALRRALQSYFTRRARHE